MWTSVVPREARLSRRQARDEQLRSDARRAANRDGAERLCREGDDSAAERGRQSTDRLAVGVATDDERPDCEHQDADGVARGAHHRHRTPDVGHGVADAGRVVLGGQWAMTAKHKATPETRAALAARA